jgi:hypothetical protein
MWKEAIASEKEDDFWWNILISDSFDVFPIVGFAIDAQQKQL